MTAETKDPRQSGDKRRTAGKIGCRLSATPLQHTLLVLGVKQSYALLDILA